MAESVKSKHSSVCLEFSSHFRQDVKVASTTDQVANTYSLFICNGNVIYAVLDGSLCEVIIADSAIVDFDQYTQVDGIIVLYMILEDGSVKKTSLTLDSETRSKEDAVFSAFMSNNSENNVKRRLLSSADHCTCIVGAQKIKVTEKYVCILRNYDLDTDLLSYDRDTFDKGSKSILQCRVPSGIPLKRTDLYNPALQDQRESVQLAIIIHPPGNLHGSVCKNIYNHMFGSDANLLNSPGVLITTAKGRIYACALKVHVERRPCSLVCDLQQPVVAVCLAKVDINENVDVNSDNNCVLFIGKHGKLTILQFNSESGAEECKFSEQHIVGPVLSAVCDETSLVYSTGSMIYVSTLVDLCKAKSGHPVKSDEFTYVNIIHLISASKKGVSSTSCISLLAVTSTGTILCILEDLWQAKQPKPLCSSTASGLKTLLTNISSSSDKCQKLQNVIEQQRAILGQLAWASLAATQQVSSAKHKHENSSNSDSVITYDISVNNKNLGYKQMCELAISVTNHSQVTLECGWSFVVTVKSEQSNENAYKETMSIPLSQLACGCTTWLYMSLPAEVTKELPLTVYPSIVYQAQLEKLNHTSREVIQERHRASAKSIQERNHSHTLDRHLITPASSVIAIPLNCQSLDLINFLLDTQTIPSSGSTFGLSDAIRNMAVSRPVSIHFENECNQVNNSCKRHHSITIQISHSCVSSLLGKKADPCHVLEYILQDSSSLEVTHGRTSMHVSTITGSHVSISLEKIQHDSESAGAEYCVSISSDNIATLCQLREALRTRLQTSPDNTDKNLNKPRSFNREDIRKARFTMQSIHRELCSLQEAVEEQNTEPALIYEQTLAVFEKLRNATSLLGS